MEDVQLFQADVWPLIIPQAIVAVVRQAILLLFKTINRFVYSQLAIAQFMIA
jgi:hypothetical protein